MKVTVNGQEMDFKEGISLQEMLDTLENKNKMIVIEQNLNIIAKKDFDTTYVKENDSIEIITFAGGG